MNKRDNLTFKSKCATLQSWRCWTASRICFTKPTASFSVQGLATTIESNSLPLGNSSITRIQFLSFSNESTITFKFGCFNRRNINTSLSTSCFEHIRFLMNLAAYSLPLILSTHFLTTENLPLREKKTFAVITTANLKFTWNAKLLIQCFFPIDIWNQPFDWRCQRQR